MLEIQSRFLFSSLRKIKMSKQHRLFFLLTISLHIGLMLTISKVCQILHVILESTSQFSSNFASIFSAIKHNSSVLFLAQTLYALVKRSPLKGKFLRFSSAWDKTCQIPHVNFPLTSQFLFKFCIILHCHNT